MTKYVDADKLAAEGWHLQRTLRDRTSISIEDKQLSDVPAAEVKTSGRWEREVVFGIRVLRCSACGKLQSYGKTSYCPNCGAEMEEDVYPSSQVYQVRERKNEQDQGIYQVPAPGAVHGVDR